MKLKTLPCGEGVINGRTSRECPLSRSTGKLVDRHRDPMILSSYHNRPMGDLYLANLEDEFFLLFTGVGLNVELD